MPITIVIIIFPGLQTCWVLPNTPTLRGVVGHLLLCANTYKSLGQPNAVGDTLIYHLVQFITAPQNHYHGPCDVGHDDV